MSPSMRATSRHPIAWISSAVRLVVVLPRGERVGVGAAWQASQTGIVAGTRVS
jgi:hypothetical protein